MSLYFQGTIPKQLNRFHINLHSRSDIALHFNPRFRGTDVIVFNSLQGGGWKNEERITKMPFQEGDSFQLIFFVTDEGYQIMVNGSEIHTFNHRVPLEEVNSLSIGGEVTLEAISIIGGRQGGIQGYPGLGDVVGIPYRGAIEGGLKMGTSLTFYGKVPFGSKRFLINLLNADVSCCDKALHFKARFHDPGQVAFNTFKQGVFEAEEKVEGMPLTVGEPFDLVFTVTAEGYEAEVNGQHFYTFKHRLPWEHVMALEVLGDVHIDSINISGGEEGVVQGYIGPGDVSQAYYTQSIDGGLSPGTSLYFHGRAPKNDWNRFHINLTFDGNIALHFNPRYKLGNVVVFNSRENGSWASEEREQECPFRKGESFHLVFFITSESYQVILNGRMFHSFKHRMPVDRVTTLEIGGEVSVQTINIIRSGTGGGEKGSGYNGRTLPIMCTGPIYNPAVPYTGMIPGAISEKRTFVIRGKVLPESNKFSINFYVSSSGDIAFHFNPRIKKGTVVRNTLHNDRWGREERHFKFNPFEAGQYFEAMIRCGSEKFKVFVNGKHMFDYAHRLKPITQIDKLGIQGDVELLYILL
ncbi:hypothetical protein GJAV_G00052850 [Gymnothorax javanicus]|nr:hypothetical protein GJAV_G00052850 [Gymnothorax javanicus]